MRPTKPATGSKAATRHKLVAAAAELIPEVGWENVSARLVATRAGLNSGVIHYHFDDMAQLRRLAAIETVQTVFQQAVGEALAEPEPRAAVSTLFGSLSSRDPHDPVLVLLYESLVAAMRDEELRLEVATSLRELRRELNGWLTDHGTANAEAAATTITAAIDGYLLQRALDPTLEPGPLVAGLHKLV